MRFIPYKFNDCFLSFEKDLVYIGTTYYEGYLVYEHLKKPIKSLFGYNIDKIELIFSSDLLIGVDIYLEITTAEINHLKDCLIDQLKQTENEILNQVFICYGKIIYSWHVDDFVIGILNKTKDDKLFIHCIINQYRFIW